MAELSTLDEKLGEVCGLAMAAKNVTTSIKKLVDDKEVSDSLKSMHADAEKVEELTRNFISKEKFKGKKTAILDKARETKQEATEMMETYLSGDVDGLDGFEFLTMAEAGEVGHWRIVAKLNEELDDSELQKVRAPYINKGTEIFACSQQLYSIKRKCGVGGKAAKKTFGIIDCIYFGDETLMLKNSKDG